MNPPPESLQPPPSASDTPASMNSAEHYLKRELDECLRNAQNWHDLLPPGIVAGWWMWDLERPEQRWCEPVLWSLLGIEPGTKPSGTGAWEADANLEPADRGIQAESLRRHLANPREPFDHTLRHRHVTGSTVWVRYRGRVLRNSAGAPTRLLGVFTDVSAAKLSEAEARQWINVFENAGWGIVIGSRDGRSLEAMNPEFARMHGFTVAELTGRPIVDVFAPESRAGLPAQIETAHRLGRHSFESVHCRKDGSTFPVLVNVSVVRDETGAVQYRAVHVHDISDRKHQAAELQRANLSRDVLDRLLEGCQIISPDWRYLYVNNAVAEQARRTPTELLGKTMMECYPGIEQSPMFAMLHRCMIERRYDRMENEFFYPDGSRGWFELRFVPVEHGICILSLDITESRSLLSAIVDDAEEAIISYSLDGVINSWNRAAERIFGYTAAEALGQAMIWLTPASLRKFDAEQTARLARGEHIDTFETMRLTKDGRLIDAAITISPLRGLPGQIVGASQIVRDISERKQAERALVAAQQAADAANQAKSQFLATMSHEIRTPLNSVINLTGLALESDLLPQDREYLVVASQSAKHLLGVINDILDFSKIEAGNIQIDAVPFGLRKVVDEVSLSFLENVQTQHLEFNAIVDTDVLDEVVGDPLRVRQVLTNLVGNAFKFTDQGEISVRIRQLDRRATHQRLRITVADTGVGITPEQRVHLFKPFSQGDSSVARKYGGSGLGLVISARLARQMNGELTLDETVERGATFHATIELELQQGTPPNSGRIITERMKRLRVLVVEDNPTTRELIEQLLNLWQMSCTSVPDAESIFNWSDDQTGFGRFGVVLMDWRLPGMDGFEAAQLVKQRTNGRLPIVMMTAFARKAEEARCAAVGMKLLRKPIVASTLYNAIADATGIVLSHPTKFASADKREFQGQRVLVVEDNEANQLVAMELLRRIGLTPELACNGQEAVTQATANPGRYAAILMDMQMPVMGGLEATRLLRADPNYQSVPIIALTANALKSDLNACRMAGMNDHIIKPIDRGLMFQTLRRWLPSAPPKPESEPSEPPAKAANPTPPALPPGPPSIEGVDVAEALDRLGLPFEFLKKQLLRFGQALPATLSELKQSAERGEVEPVLRSAHTLVGSARTLGAHAFAAAAAALEKCARESRPADFVDAFAAVQRAAESLLRGIALLAV